MEHAKTRLHNRVGGHGWARPEYDWGGPFAGATDRQWLCIVRINGAEWGRGYGASRSAASEMAATAAYNALVAQGY
ncbi:hypothetical protein GGF50DRAFT_116644 [Schizophyllum commune]